MVIPRNAQLGLEKSLLSNADEDRSGTVSLGDTLTYSFVATNTGNVTLTGVTIVDGTLPGLSALICTPPQPATLAPTQTLNCTATYVVTQADAEAGQIDNLATADSDETDPVDDTENVPVAPPPVPIPTISPLGLLILALLVGLVGAATGRRYSL